MRGTLRTNQPEIAKAHSHALNMASDFEQMSEMVEMVQLFAEAFSETDPQIGAALNAFAHNLTVSLEAAEEKRAAICQLTSTG